MKPHKLRDEHGASAYKPSTAQVASVGLEYRLHHDALESLNRVEQVVVVRDEPAGEGDESPRQLRGRLRQARYELGVDLRMRKLQAGGNDEHVLGDDGRVRGCGRSPKQDFPVASLVLRYHGIRLHHDVVEGNMDPGLHHQHDIFVLGQRGMQC